MPAPLALVTGASGGIGEALAREFVRNGYDVALCARSQDKLTTLAAELAGDGSRTHVIPADLARPDGPPSVLDALQALELDVDVLVNNAGYGLTGGVGDTDAAALLDMIDLNIRALSELTALLLPAMIERRRGGVLNVASTAAFLPGPFMAGYYASKAFVRSFSEALSEELRDTGVHATAPCPGPVRSGFQDRANMAGLGLLKVSPMMTPQRVARIGYRAFARKKRVCVPGLSNKLTVVSAMLTPRRLLLPMVARLQRRGT